MEYKLQKLLGPLGSDYDYIFIDCAPTDSVLTTMALTASQYFLIQFDPIVSLSSDMRISLRPWKTSKPGLQIPIM